MLLKDKVILVTGGARGLGLAVASEAARQGASVALVDNGVTPEGSHPDPKVVADAAAGLQAAGAKALGLAVDVGEPANIPGLVGQIEESLGPIDGLVASAGLYRERSLLQHDPAELDALIGVHIRGVFALTAEVARAMVARKTGGSMVLLCSPNALFGVTRQSGLAAVSGATMALVRSAAVEFRKHNVRVNGLAATARTRTTEHLPTFQGIDSDSMTPEQVAPVAGFLLSDLSSAVSGEIVGVAGSRVYALRGRESAGDFFDPVADPSQLAARWTAITRG